MTAEEIQRLIRERAAVGGVPAEPFLAMAKNETNYGQAANRPGSQYQGVMQMGKAASSEVGLDRKLVNDPVANIDAAIKLAKKNAAYLGVPITRENAGVIYAAHQQGAGAVKKWLSADPNTPIADIITAEQANANGMAGMTVAQAKAKWIDGTQKLADQWADVTSKQDLRQAAIASGDSVANPQSQLGAVQGYNQEMIQAAQKIANNNLSAVNNFGWNPTVDGSSAQRFGKTVSTNTDTLSQLYDRNMQHLQAFTNPTKDTYLGRVGDKVKAAFNISGNALTEEYLKRAEASQSVTGDSLAKQVANMKTTMDGTVINPAYLDKAAGNLTQQQQVENQTYDAVTGNANPQQQLKQTEKANGAVGNPDDSSLVNAARSLGIQLPEGMKTSDIKAVLGDKLPTVQAVAANNGKLGSDPYTAVKVAQMPGVSPEVLMAAQPHIAFQQQILAKANLVPPGSMINDEGKVVPNPLSTKESIAAEQAAYDSKARAIVIKAYEDAANGTPNALLKGVTANPYSAMRSGAEVKTLANGLPLPKGISPEEVGTLGAETFINKAFSAGATSVEIANFYKGLSANVNKDIKFDIFAAKQPTGSFKVKLKGVDNSIDLATPAGVEQFQAIIKSGNVARDQKGGILGMLRAAYNNDEATFRRVAAGGNLIYE